MITRRTALRLAGSAVGVGLAGCFTTETDSELDWPTFAHDPANSGVTQSRGPSDPEERWSEETEMLTSSPAVVDGTVYVGSIDGTVYALDADTGAAQWTYSVEGTISATPSVSGNRIYVVVYGDTPRTGTVHAITTDGSEEWQTDLDEAPLSGCTVVDETLYLSMTPGDVLALDASSGDEEWREWGGGIRCTPAVVDGTVYSFGTGGLGGPHGGVALDAATGEEQWHYDGEGVGALPWHAPSVGDDAVVVGSGQGNLLALDRSSGDERWVFDLEGSVNQSPVIAGDTLYVGITHGDIDPSAPPGIEPGTSVVAVDVDSGEERWRHTIEDYGATAVLGSETLYRRTLGEIATLDTDDGEPGWTHDTAFTSREAGSFDYRFEMWSATSQPAVVDGTLFVASPFGGVDAIGEA